METNLFLINSQEEYQDFQEKRNFCEDTLVKPIVGYIPDENVVMYDAHILPENKELWEKFNLIYGQYVTCEDEWLFSTQPMTYETWKYADDGIYVHELNFNTNITPCFDYNHSNPEYKELRDHITIESTNEIATIDDFIGFGGEHNWKGAACGK